MEMEAYVRLAFLTARACLIAELVFVAFTKLPRVVDFSSPDWTGHHGALVLAAYFVTGGLAWALLKRAERVSREWLTETSLPLTQWVTDASPESLRRSIFVLAGLTLFLELALIRWQASLFPAFALYKNFTLLACFCGLGIGYALALRSPLLLPATLPMLALNLLLLTVLRYGSDMPGATLLFVVPVSEEGSVLGSHVTSTDFLTRFLYSIPVYLLLVGTFSLNALTLVPAGQFCGYLMEQDTPLTSYGCNLLGSIAGVVHLFVLSWFWTGPVLWFGLSAGVLLSYVLVSPPARRVALWAAALCVMVVAWPVEPLVQSIYSPYQLIQKVTTSDGLMRILASGSYFQEVWDLSASNANRETNKRLRDACGYYELPFRTADSLGRVAIVGAGSGNDVAAALRCGASAVDAVEIDPAVRDLGRQNHPERPYQDARVRSIVNDARTFFRRTDQDYDAIVYSLLDSHILLSHGSNVRVDSFVYTEEAFREAYAHLKAGGLMSVSFTISAQNIMDKKVFRMLTGLPGASAPLAILPGNNPAHATTFMIKKGGETTVPGEQMKYYGHRNVSHMYVQSANEPLDIPTDDWPFFYMDTKTYPTSYVLALAMILVMSLGLVRLLLPGHGWDRSLVPFFLLGAGFMLVETKAITELGLLFGNTWHTIAITLVSVLLMAFLANALVGRVSVSLLIPAFAMLLSVILAGYFVATRGSVPHAGLPSKLAVLVLLTSPLFFSGIVFSTLLKATADVAGAMAYNLMGAMVGGLLEYNSMQYGFASLYVMALAFYGAGWIASRPVHSRGPAL
jgi:hypothetical protein